MSTYAGTDVHTGRAVVVKTVPTAEVSAAMQLRLEDAADALAGIGSPAIACPLAVGRERDVFFIVRPYVEGLTLEQRLQAGRLGAFETLALASGIMGVLQLAHEHGVLHRAVKPGNVIVNGDLVTLVDFAFAPTTQVDSYVRDVSVDAVRYVSPEQAGLLHRDVDERSDLYSAGALLFECLAGQPPFTGDSVTDVLREHLTHRPPSLRRGDSAIPTALDELVMRLLRKDPRDRYQSADAVLQDLGDLEEALSRGVEDPQIVLGLHERRRRSLTEPAFVARGPQLLSLEREVDRSADGTSGLVLLEAPSGGGKSRLLDELERSSAQRDVWVLRGQGRDRGAQRPFQVLDGVVRAVVMRCMSDPAFASGLRRQLAGREDALLDAMPDLAPALGQAPAPATSGSEQHGETRTIRALADLLDALGSPERPAVVMLDDCQWADEQTLKLLAHWRRTDDGGEDRRTPVLVLVAFRAEEVARAHPLRTLRPSSRVALDPLSASAICDLVESMAGVIPQQASELVTRLAEGNPFVAVEILRGLVETGAMVAADGGWRVVDELLVDVQSSGRSAAIFGRRLQSVPDELLELLSVGAVLGKHFAVDLAGELAQRSPRDTLRLLDDARRRHIVWSDAEGECCAFVHDKLREALLDRLPAQRRHALHRAAALRLRQQDGTGAFELAYHFDAAGDHGQALPYALEAAASARSRYALDVAQRQYEIALRGATEPAGTRDIAEGLGDVAMLRGRYEDAAVHFAAARELCDSDLLAAGIDGKLGELAFKRGDVKSAAELLERALRLLDQRVPRSRAGFALALLWQVVIQFAHSVAPRLFVGRRRRAPTAPERLTMRLHSELAHAYWFGFGLMPCGWTHLRGLNLAERHPPTAELAQAYSEHAPVTTMIPWARRGIAYAERSLAIRRALGDRWGEGQSLGFYSVVLYTASRFGDAVEKAATAVEILERTGDRWEVNLAGWHSALSLYRLGRMEEAVAAAQRVHRGAVAVGDNQSSGIAIGAWAKASGGAVPPELVEAELEHPAGDVHTRVEVLQAKALGLIAQGRIDEAVAVLIDADAYARRSGLRQEYVAPVRPWLVTALRMQLEQTSGLAAAQRRRLARKARRVARSAHRLARSYANNLPHALRERALLEAMAGRPRRARRMLERSLAVALEQGAQHEVALTRGARATLRGALGDDPRHEDRDHRRSPHDELQFPPAPQAAAALAPGVTLSLADRFATVLDAGRAITSALTEEAVCAAVVGAAETLLRGECCAVVALDDEGARAVGVRAGDLDAEPTPAIVERTLRHEATVVMSEDDLQRDPGAGSGPGRVRSALCAPIFVRGRATACLYVIHSEVASLFGDEESRLASFVTALAGAALENAEGFSEVQALSATLEDRVARRTAELRASMERVEVAASVLSATLEATADGLLVVDLEGRIVNHNKRFAELWRIPDHVLEARDDDRAIAYVLEQLRHPDAFKSTTIATYADPDAETRDELEFLDGRVFERCSKPHRLAGKSVGRVWSFRDVTEQKRFEGQLKNLADHDALTGLVNRRRFEQDLAREAGVVGRYGGSLAALLLDIDNFKFINDTLGHKAGDELIRSIARLLRGRLRTTDVLARLGGDEFAMLLPGSSPEHAQLVATDLLELIRRHTAFAGGERVSMTASIGVALLAENDTDGSQLIVDADLAMYAAKAAGRDGFSYSTPERAQQARLAGRYTWGERIRQALEHDGFVLHAQPILDLASGALSRHELLLRMRGDDGTLIPPNAFLPSAERLNLVQAIDRWVVSEAILVIAEYARAGQDICLEVNLSGRSMGDRELTQLIERELAATQINPASLIFEVTETSAIANMEAAQEFARTLSELGCRFALDDFGTGFGSFYYLKYLPVSYLKIDGEFIVGLADNESDQLMVKAIVQIARGLGKRTIAEFVGDARTQALLAQYGVDFAQGYHIGKPVDLVRPELPASEEQLPAA